MITTSPLPSTSDTPSQPAPAGHLGWVDGLRGLAILLVMAGHATYGIGPAPEQRGWVLASVVLGSYGYVGVHLFLLISGFCLFYPLIKGGGGMRPLEWRAFARRRLRRICPPYYAAIAVVCLVEWLLRRRIAGGAYGFDGADVAGHLTFLHSVMPAYQGSLDPAFWSIGLEMQLYLVFPLVVWACARFGLMRTVAALIAGVVAFRLGLAWLEAEGPFYGARAWRTSVLGRWSEFGFGMLAAAVVAGLPDAAPLRRLPPLAAGLTGLAVLGAAAVAFRLAGPYTFYLDLAWGLGFFGLVLAAIGTPRLGRWLAWAPLAFVGRVSYSAYLLHGTLFLVLHWAMQQAHWPRAWCYPMLTTAGIALVLLVAWAFHHAVERPFMGR